MTRNTLHAFLISLAVFTTGCANNGDSPSEAIPEPTAIPDQSSLPPEKRLRTGPRTTPQQSADTRDDVVAVTFGRGVAKGNGLSVTFMHNVSRYKDGTADGEFKHSAVGDAGIIDIDAKVTCAELDSESNKGWVGGKVTRNASTNPVYLADVGTDVWFRILDLGETEQTALISMPTFKQKGIKSAEGFCDKKPWSDDDLLKIDAGSLAIFP